MGHYTGLRVKAKIKPEYDVLIRALHWCEPISEQSRWERATLISDCYFPDWIKFGRCDFIPFGGMCYMPDDFSESGEQESFYDVDSGIWEFACSLKNYQHEIQYFVENVLKVISEEIFYCESLYEEYPMIDYSKSMFESQYTDWRDYTCKY
jgi:hypothetical protein